MMKRTIACVTLLLCSWTGFGQIAPAAQAPKAAPAARSKASPPAAVEKPWQKIPIPPLPPFHPQQPKRIELKNGMVIFLQEDHELPFVSGSATVRGGSIAVPAEKTGMMSIYGEVWRTGGTTKLTGDQMDDFLEARAASIETGAGAESTSISFNCLKGNLDEVFPLFLDLLRNPAFRQDKIDLAKMEMNTSISRRNDDVDSIAGREALRLAYGKDNPFARIPEYATVASVTRDDLAKWHDAYVHPNNMLVDIEGDFDAAAMEQRLRQAFDAWPRAEVPAAPKVRFEDPKPGVYFVDKEDVNQSEIRMVTLGIERKNPDYFNVEVMNEVLGGGFASRLFKNIRTKLGLAYSVGGGIGAAFDHPGIFSLGMGTKSQSTVPAIEALREQMGKMLTDPVTEAEVKEAKDSILNRFIFNFDSKSKVLGERLLYEFYGYPPDFLEQYRAGIEKTTAADVNRVARKYIHSGQFAVLVVGNQKEFQTPLSKLGPVVPIDIAIPEPGTAQATKGKPAESDPQAKALLEKFVNFMGGAQAAGGVKSVHTVSSGEQQTEQGQMQLETDTYTALPDETHATIKAPQFPAPIEMIIGKDGAWMAMQGQGSRDMPASAKQDRLASIHRSPIAIAQHAADESITMGEKTAEGQTIHISGNGVDVDWVIDPQTGRLVSSTFTAMGPQGPAKRTIVFSDWRAAGDLKVPFKAVVQENGKDIGSETITTYQINPPIDPKLFQKPE
jgi:zinc protease